MTVQVRMPDYVGAHRLAHGYFDDLDEFVTGDKFTSLAADSGSSVAMTDAANGVVALTTGGTDNNEALLKGTSERFLMAANKPIVFEAYEKFTEANTDDANVFVGMSDAAGANLMVDNGAGPKTSFSGFGFFKVDGGTRWNVITSLGSTQTKTELTAANSLDKLAKTAGGGVWQALKIVFRPIDTTRAEIDFYIDGVLVYQEANFTFTSATEIQEAAYIKAGGSNSEVLSVDWLSVWQTR